MAGINGRRSTRAVVDVDYDTVCVCNVIVDGSYKSNKILILNRRCCLHLWLTNSDLYGSSIEHLGACFADISLRAERRP
jgi:hypothetical protein